MVGYSTGGNRRNAAVVTQSGYETGVLMRSTIRYLEARDEIGRWGDRLGPACPIVWFRTLQGDVRRCLRSQCHSRHATNAATLRCATRLHPVVTQRRSFMIL